MADARKHARTFPLSALQGGEGGDPARSDGEGEVGIGQRGGVAHLTPTLSAPKGGEGNGAGEWNLIPAAVMLVLRR